ncbi:hypothetical protein N8Y88_00535 [Saprospiraceae bacterium]|nr:hypothetical protein [Saprospiraceae bacterium]
MGEVRVKNAQKVSSIIRQNFEGISKFPTRVLYSFFDEDVNCATNVIIDFEEKSVFTKKFI